MKPAPRNDTVHRTVFDTGASRLRSLCGAIGLGNRSESIVDVFGRLIDPWGHRTLGDCPVWPSYIGDDHTPIEFSLTFGAKPEVRILLEPLGDSPSLVSNRDAAVALLESMASEFAIDLMRFERIQNLFCPATPSGLFSVWIAVAFSGDSRPDFKIYLNPAAQGQKLAPALVEEALVRLGFPGAWPTVSRSLLRRGPEWDELNYLALDLSESPDARVKVYARHFGCSVTDLEAVASASRSYDPGDLKAFLGLVAPDAENDVFEGRSPCTCYSFVGGQGDIPVAATTHFPINSYAPNDGAVRHRVLACLERFGIASDSYARSIGAFANRPLDEDMGMHSYVSFRRYRGEARLTTYLAVEAYRPGTVEAGSNGRASGVVEVAKCFGQFDAISEHPFCRRMEREPIDARTLWILLANLDAVDRGSGACEKLRMLPQPSESAATFKGPPDSTLDAWLRPGRSLDSRLAAIAGPSNADEFATASMAVEFMQGQLERFASSALRRWLRSAGPAGCANAGRVAVDPQGLDTREFSAGLGAFGPESAVARAAWQFLDDLYSLCYGCESPSRDPFEAQP